jgi:C1A family cysteine protease
MFVFAALAAAAFNTKADESQFVAWMRQYNLIYVGEEYQFRFGIFLANKKFVQDHNRASTFRVELNKFACLTPGEYRQLTASYVTPAKKPLRLKISAVAADDPFDWRTYTPKVVTDPRDQGQCGADWAIAAIVSIESVDGVKTGNLQPFSAQNLIDCDRLDKGCDGGSINNAFEYISDYQSIHVMKESDYPYTGVKGSCQYDANKAVYALTGYTDLTSEAQVVQLVKQLGPGATTIDGSQQDFQLYKSGIYNNPACSSTSVNHCLGIIGWGNDSGTEFWILKNSFGLSWGESGYIRLLKNGNNFCGITTAASIAIFH